MPNESFGFDITSKTEAGQIFEMSHRKNRTPSISTGEVTPCAAQTTLQKWFWFGYLLNYDYEDFLHLHHSDGLPVERPATFARR